MSRTPVPMEPKINACLQAMEGRLGPEQPAALETFRMPLLPSGPDGVNGIPSRGPLPSTPPTRRTIRSPAFQPSGAAHLVTCWHRDGALTPAVVRGAFERQ